MKTIAAGDIETLEAENLSDFIKRDHDLGTAIRVSDDTVDELALHLRRRKLYEGLWDMVPGRLGLMIDDDESDSSIDYAIYQCTFVFYQIYVCSSDQARYT